MTRHLIALTLILLAPAAYGADPPLAWPQFRGPGGSGVADGQKPPVEIGPDKNVKWKVAVPSGLSSPIVVDDKLVITAFDGGKLYTIAYDRATGKEAWRSEAPATEIEAYNKTEGSPAASTPATDGKRIVSYFGSCGLVCYDASGKELWQFELPPAVIAGDFGSGVSPILVEDTVVLVRDETKNSRIYGIDLATGAVKWEQKRRSPTSYSTPVLWDTPAGKQVAATGHAQVVGYDVKNGAEQWVVNCAPSACCASPVTESGILYFAGWSPGSSEDNEFQMPTFDSFLTNLDKDKDGALSREEAETAFAGMFDSQDANGDGQVTRDEWDAILKFMSEGKNCAFALKPGGAGDVTNSNMVWKQTKGLPYVSSAIAYQGQYVMVKDGGIVTAYDLQLGKQVFHKRAVETGAYYASPVAANGQIYFTNLEGAVTVLKAGEKEPVVVMSNPKLGERTSATPAIADDTLYVRTEKHLYAFEEAQ